MNTKIHCPRFGLLLWAVPPVPDLYTYSRLSRQTIPESHHRGIEIDGWCINET